VRGLIAKAFLLPGPEVRIAIRLICHYQLSCSHTSPQPKSEARHKSPHYGAPDFLPGQGLG
jgi:hypothetical protein